MKEKRYRLTKGNTLFHIQFGIVSNFFFLFWISLKTVLRKHFALLTSVPTVLLSRVWWDWKENLALGFVQLSCLRTLLQGSEVKASACSVGDLGSIPGSGRSPGEGNGNPLQYSCLENPMDRGIWWATVHGVTKSRTRLSDFTYSLTHN